MHFLEVRDQARMVVVARVKHATVAVKSRRCRACSSMLPLWIVLATSAFLVAGCHSASRPAVASTQPSSTATTQRAAVPAAAGVASPAVTLRGLRHAMLSTAELPSGYSANLGAQVYFDPPCGRSNPAVHRDTGYWIPSGPSSSVGEILASYRNEQAASEYFGEVRRQVSRCSTSRIDGLSYAIKGIPWPTYGDESFAISLATVSDIGARTIDALYVRVGSTILTLSVDEGDTTVDPILLHALAPTAIARLQQIASRSRAPLPSGTPPSVPSYHVTQGRLHGESHRRYSRARELVADLQRDGIPCSRVQSDAGDVWASDGADCFSRDGTLGVYLFTDDASIQNWFELAAHVAPYIINGDYWAVTADSRKLAEEVHADVGGNLYVTGAQ